MAYSIDFTPDATLDLGAIPKRDEVIVRDSVLRYLKDEPTAPSHKRKELAPNPLGARWELRLGELRVYYDVDGAAQRVRVLRVGRKFRESIVIRGVATDLRG
jgi:mRNA-degrading endonuclease RelE of RelBE toxin-antitoxin system